MKKIFVSLVFILSICVFAFAQDPLPELEIVKEIKLLKSTRLDVIEIMSEFDRDKADDESEEDYNQRFRSEKATVRVSYSTGDCSEDAGIRNYPKWDVPKMTATKIVITFDETTKLKDLGLRLSDFKKKSKNDKDTDSEDYIYYNEKAGIIILTDEGEVEKIILHPPKKQSGSLCRDEDDEENDSEVFSRKTSFVDSIISSENYCILINQPSNVTNLDLQTKAVSDCQGGNCSDIKKEVRVKTTAIDPENDVLTYDYAVEVGKIIGSGSEVIWDLTGVKPGVYTITAGSDDSCGVCGETKSRKILVKENSYEPIPSALIKKMTLDKTELTAGCPIGKLKRMLCPFGSCGISVTSVAVAPDNQNLTYRYKISGGEIVGSGERIIWNLAGLSPGEYSITTEASDDGTNFGTPETKTVEIKENPYCSALK